MASTTPTGQPAAKSALSSDFPWMRRREALRTMTKRARETTAYKSSRGRRKRARGHPVSPARSPSPARTPSPPRTPSPARPLSPASPVRSPPPASPADDPFPISPARPLSPASPLRSPPPASPANDSFPVSPARPLSPAPPPHQPPINPPDYTDIAIPRRPNVDVDIDGLAASTVLPHLKESMEYILALRRASLDDPVSRLDDEMLERIRHPRQSSIAINAPHIRHSITAYLGCEHASQRVYETFRYSHNANFPDQARMLTFREVGRLIAEYTGVEKILHDMCPQTCVGYTGPLEDLESCPKCGLSRWSQEKLQLSNGCVKVAARQFTTIPLAPQLQARYRHPESARDMAYLYERSQSILADLKVTGEIPVYDNIVMGWDFLHAVVDGHVKEKDIVIMISMNSAQLYQSKESDCWIYIWILLNLSPDKRYKKINVLPGGFIPGPNKPQNVDSFLFPGLHHLSALQREGLAIWDSNHGETFR